MLQVVLVGNQERAMVVSCRPSMSASGSVGEWVWPDPGRPCKARFVLRDQQKEELWSRLDQSELSACNDLTTAEVGLVKSLKKVRLARRTASVELLNFARVSPYGFSFPLVGNFLLIFLTSCF
jgi:hypothetical protein